MYDRLFRYLSEQDLEHQRVSIYILSHSVPLEEACLSVKPKGSIHSLAFVVSPCKVQVLRIQDLEGKQGQNDLYGK